ncbi:anhydro-N-acetylmuramic acid kinase [Rhodobium gokarnense]|uniref:Anhydro-N-acetylmuramic acid kinase n=1 Tax=Rhodobium gokarnense TaxID=364296 RepID=A0ABT3HAK7_9HYPH|nr:anhydro-N-acetylmuramic acid kinase [Rhodobium gokarnense]MCW2307425.1 anhydro-N-acetylmuramic acid kinase [Rhodobium gokarnense]
MKTFRAIGLMSGTSFDGVDAAIIETDGEKVFATGPGLTQPYTDDERQILRTAMAVAAQQSDRDARPPELAEAELVVTEAHAKAVDVILAAAGRDRSEIDIIGFHGQTVFHAPDRHLTIQLGDGNALSRATGIPVVFDFRKSDVAAGGQGAPMVPVYHRALADQSGLERPLAIINLGGVANFTWIGRDGAMVACDTGPASALIDDWVFSHSGAAFDMDGELAASGTVDRGVLGALLDNPYFGLPAPKSLDRHAFSLDPVRGLSLEDGAATLTAFTAETLAIGLKRVPETPRMLVVCGGGAHNPSLLSAIERATGIFTVVTGEALGWSSDHIEAEAFGYLAVRRMLFLPISFPMTTAVDAPMMGGEIAAPK